MHVFYVVFDIKYCNVYVMHRFSNVHCSLSMTMSSVNFSSQHSLEFQPLHH